MFSWLRFRRTPSKPTTTRRTRLTLEPLEERAVPSATSFVYTETENTTPDQNAVFAFARNGSNQLTQIGSFATDGTGFTNTGLLGPQDSDKEVIASPDGRFLFAVNQGSNSIAAFQVQPGGSLALINGTAVSSGGTEPVSLAIAQGRLYVVNRGNELQGQPATIAPSITVFNIAADGTLTQNLAATTPLSLGLSPSQVLPDPSANLVFVDTFTPPPLDTVPEANEILPFQIGANGRLIPAAGGGVGTSSASPPVSSPLLLGLTLNPSQDILYAGLTGASEVGVFTFNSSGNLTLEDTVAVQGAAPCWTTVSPNGQYLYTVDTGTNSVGVFSLAHPLQPTQIQEFALGGPLNATGSSSAPRETTDFEFSFDPSGNTLYVIDHQTGTLGDFPQGNALHVLSVAANGMLSEGANSPVILPSDIPLGADPQGVAVIVSPGPGATVVGNSLYLVGGNGNDQLNITPIGTSPTGSTGIKVNGQLNNVHLDNQTFPQNFTTIFVVDSDGNDNIQFAHSLTVATVISVGNGNDNLQLDNGSNTVTLGNGNDNLQAGDGSNTVVAGNGNDNVQLGNGSYDSVTLGNGNNNVQVGNGNYATIIVGNGNDNVQLGNGSYDFVTLGNGNDNVQAGHGTNNVLQRGSGQDHVQVGNGWQIL